MKVLVLFICSLMIYSAGLSQHYVNRKKQLVDALYFKTEGDLSKLSDSILLKYKDDAQFIKRFNNVQKAWSRFRDSQVELKYPVKEKNADDDLIICIEAYKTQLTKERIETLGKWLKENSKDEECAGTE